MGGSGRKRAGGSGVWPAADGDCTRLGMKEKWATGQVLFQHVGQMGQKAASKIIE
jgi:hypothetical protein